MIDKDLLENIKQLAAERMTSAVQLVMTPGEHDKREELKDFLQGVAQASDLITVKEENTGLDSPMSFKLVTDNGDTGIIFSGIPSGHEFSSLILAILQAGGSDIKLDEGVQKIVRGIDQPLQFTTYVSLSCHNCPDVVQSLNQFALLNSHISHEMVEGGVFQDRIEANNIQGVPAVFLNGESFANGKIDTAKLIEKLQQRYPELMHSSAQEEGAPQEQQDVTVIGGGPAGVAAAIYTARKGLKVTMVTDRIGGQVKDTQGIENLISVPLTTGGELAAKFGQHLQEYPITVKEHVKVKALTEADNDSYKIELNTGETVNTRSIILATGAQWRKLNVPGEDENVGGGVAYCPHCDGPFFKGKDVAVIGGGNSGVEAALDLVGIVNHVTVFEFADSFKADQVLLDKAHAHANIAMLSSVATKEIKADNGRVTSIVYEDRQSKETKELPVAAVFVQIGLVPNSGIVKGLVELNQAGEIEIDERCHTSRKGIFACGDVTTVPFKQINIAMGEGSKAALSAFEYLMMH